MYDLIIIGAGPAGLTAAIYAAREKLNTLLVTKEWGGQMAKKEVEIENYPGFPKIAAADLIVRFREHVAGLKVDVEMETVKEIQRFGSNFRVLVGQSQLEARSVLVASGSDPRFLGVPGEKEFIGRGVGYCATCDGPLFSGLTVAVAGGGNSAFESALFLTRYAKKVYLLEGGSQVRASAELVDKLASTGKAEVILNARVAKIIGDKFVSAIEYLDAVSQSNKSIAINGLFVKIGYSPASALVADLAERNEAGEIKFDIATHMTKTPGLFVSGDVSDIKYKQIIIACGEGAKAVLSISEYLRDLPKTPAA